MWGEMRRRSREIRVDSLVMPVSEKPAQQRKSPPHLFTSSAGTKRYQRRDDVR
jgi:hypothetical protein